MQFIYGMHDPGGEFLFADRKGWIVFTEAIGHDPNDKAGRDYRQWSDAGYGVLVRLNNGYGSAGTIPTPDQYGNFAWRVAHFIVASKGADTWIIGNEPNHSNERPDGKPITPEMYIDCFNQVHGAVRDHAGTRHGLIPAPVALWNTETGDWLEYQERVWRALWRISAGFALHTYTHGASPALITSMERMGAPFTDRFYHFMAYRQLMTRVPVEARGLPAYITETDQNDPWVDAKTGWVEAAYDEIDRWNATDGTQKIYCLCLYRWPKHDQWYIEGKIGVINDLRAAVARGFRAPLKGKEQMPETHIPVVSPGTSSPSLPPRQIDPRLTQRGVTIETPQLAPGQQFWRVVKAQWYNEQEADGIGPDHHILVDVLDSTGKRVGAGLSLLVEWPSDHTLIYTEAKPGEPWAANYPMSKSLNEFSISVNDVLAPSEVVRGIGMGADGNSGIHTSTGVVFQLTKMPAATTPTTGEGPTPAGTIAYITEPMGANLRTAPITGQVIIAIPYAEEIRILGVMDTSGWLKVAYGDQEGYMAASLVGLVAPEPLPAPATGEGPTPVEKPQPTGDNWTRSRAFVRKWEGGYSDNPEDHGNWTGGQKGVGELKGTKYGISAASYPQLDIRNLTMAEADAIYFRDYWQASNAASYPWPYCLLAFDTAVLHGVETSRKWQKEVGDSPLAFAAKRLRVYTKLDNWDEFGAGWTNRVADLLEEASKP